ncbi:hypothetical protein HWV62_5754 [Athelia sp. TMB]|nr:hypothetical protein HWV62_5754 [Athelia sp. TMB]
MEQAIGKAIRRIVEIVADTLEVVALDVPAFTFSVTPIAPMPRLTDLICTTRPLQNLCSPEQPAFPRLQRLHITALCRPFNHAKFFEEITELAPSLKYLKFSGIHEDRSFCHVLGLVLGRELSATRRIFDDPYAPGPVEAKKLPRSIERLYGQPAGRFVAEGSILFAYVYDQLLADLQELDGYGETRFVLLEADTDAEEQARKYRLDWEAAIIGEQDRWRLENKFGVSKGGH